MTSKRTVTSRINIKELDKIDAEAERLGLNSKPAFINWLLAKYFYALPALKK